MINKFRMATTCDTTMVDGLIGRADGRYASLGYGGTIIQVACAAAPEIV